MKDLPYLISEGIVALGAMAGNALLLLAYRRFRVLRTPTNVFVVSRGLADLLLGVTIVLAVLLPCLNLVENFSTCLFVNTLLVLADNVSILGMAGIAFERFVAVRCPFHHTKLLSLRNAYRISAGIWTVGLSLAIALAILHKDQSSFTRCSFVQVLDVQYMYYIIFFPMTIPTTMGTIAAFSYIFYVVRKKSEQDRSLEIAAEHHQTHYKVRQRKREVTGLFLIVMAYVACKFPLQVYNIFSYAMPKEMYGLPESWRLTQALIVLSHFCSVVNPVLYVYYNTKLTEAVKRIVRCSKLRRIASLDTHKTTSTYRNDMSMKTYGENLKTTELTTSSLSLVVSTTRKVHIDPGHDDHMDPAALHDDHIDPAAFHESSSSHSLVTCALRRDSAETSQPHRTSGSRESCSEGAREGERKGRLARLLGRRRSSKIVDAAASRESGNVGSQLQVPPTPAMDTCSPRTERLSHLSVIDEVTGSLGRRKISHEKPLPPDF